MTFRGKVRERVKSFFNPAAFDPTSFRHTVQMAMLGLVLGEISVFILLKQSARVGELPNYITDVLIIGISAVEFILGPLIGWLGSQRRRNIMVGWVVVALACMLPVFGVPKPEAEVDTALCNVWRTLPAGITPMAALRLSILILVGISCALTRLAIMTHALAYLEESNPSMNLHMNIAVLLLVRIVLLLVGTTMLSSMMDSLAWLQFLMIVVKLIITIVRLYKYPVVPPTMDIRHGADRGFFRSVGRVLRSKMAVLQILAMSLLAAALWGFGSQEADFAKFKFHVVPGTGMIWEWGAPLRALFIIMGVILAGYLYTNPVMPVLDKKAAILNAGRMTIYCVILFAVMTAALNCSKGEVAGLEETTYSQPFCALGCGCDRPWTQFDPVCATEHMTTFYSPCHAGCATATTIGNLAVYTNCTCSPNGHVTVGACGDNSCTAAYSLHTLMFAAATLAGTLAFVWQITIMLEAVDRRDKSVALGIASGTVSLFAFVGAHGVYVAIGAYSCALFRGQVCLFQNSNFVPRVGYTSIGLAGASLIITIIAYIVQYRQIKSEENEKKKEIEDVDLSRE
ncbi:hypothetical protein MSG28_011672 [Choristoneura fumiferana]|uniref:Uncharacterized protein n=1 Tax=Choristoneura fumiferana TaxID=7141 RepID=A0ACC0KMP3_CHOFU|nr:hypothetical protein MSG28_011672 [Choristoneura fumiferana]